MTGAGALLLLTLGAAPPEDVTIRVTASSDVLSRNEVLQLGFHFPSRPERMFTPPVLPAFDLVSGPQEAVSIVNSSASYTWTFAYRPRQEGDFTLGPFELRAGDTVYRGPALTVRVVKESERQRALREALLKKVFVRLDVSRKQVFVGEQVVRTISFHEAVGLRLPERTLVPLSTAGFLEKPLGRQETRQEEIDGVLFQVVELHSALFPLAPGRLTLGPAQVDVKVAVPGRRRRGDRGDDFFGSAFEEFFGRGSYEQVRLSSEPVELEVLPHPAEGRPEGFGGAVGDFELEGSAKPATLRAGDPVTVTLKIAGEGNVENLSPPRFTEVPGFKVYEPEVQVTTSTEGRRLEGTVTVTQVVVPTSESATELPALAFSYLDTGSRGWRTLSWGPTKLSVSPPADRGSGIVAAPGERPAAAIPVLERDILPQKERAGLREHGAAWFESPLYLGGLSLPWIALFATTIWARRRERLRGSLALRRWKGARAAARAGLDEAAALERAGSASACYGALARTLGRFLADQTGVPPMSYGGAGTAAALVERGLDEERAQRVETLLLDLEARAFGGMDDNAEARRERRERVEALVTELDRRFPEPS